jgi:hypothetical protein
MAFNDADHQREQQRREDAYLARASACYMSNAKWRKFFAVLRTVVVGPLRWKFVRDDRVFTASIPPPTGLREDGFGDIMPYPYGSFREIDWVEVPAEHAAAAVEALATVGHFPIRYLASGVRVVGYSWPPSDAETLAAHDMDLEAGTNM